MKSRPNRRQGSRATWPQGAPGVVIQLISETGPPGIVRVQCGGLVVAPPGWWIGWLAEWDDGAGNLITATAVSGLVDSVAIPGVTQLVVTFDRAIPSVFRLRWPYGPGTAKATSGGPVGVIDIGGLLFDGPSYALPAPAGPTVGGISFSQATGPSGEDVWSITFTEDMTIAPTFDATNVTVVYGSDSGAYVGLSCDGYAVTGAATLDLYSVSGFGLPVAGWLQHGGPPGDIVSAATGVTVRLLGSTAFASYP